MTLQRSRRELLANVGFSSAVSVLVKLRGVLLLPIITRSAGTADYGIWVQVTALVALFPPLFGLNLHNAVVRFGLNVGAPAARALFRQVAFRVVAFSFAIAITLTLLILWLDIPDIRQRSLLLGCTWLAPPVALCKLGVAHIRGQGQVKRASLVEAMLRLSAMAAAASAFVLGRGVEGALFALTGVFSLFAAAMTLPKLRIDAQAQAAEPTSTYLRYALPTIPAALADWSLFAFDRYALGIFVDNTAAGIYSATYSLALLMRMFGAPIAFALLPAVGKLWDRNRREQAVQLTTDAALLSVVICVLAAVLLTRNGSWILGQLSTEEIAQGAEPLLPYLTSGLVLWTVTRVFIQLFVAEKRTGNMAKVLITSALLNMACNVLFIPALGAVGAALATLLAYAFALGHALFLLRGTLTIRWLSLQSLRLGACVATVIAALVIVPRSASWAGVFLEGFAFSVGFGGLLLATRTLTVPRVFLDKLARRL